MSPSEPVGSEVAEHDGAMLNWLNSRRLLKAQASDLYGRVVAQARKPELYGDYGVSDTPEGRLEAIILHLVLLIARLRGEGEAGGRLARAIAEAFVTDMDDCLREMGVGDLTVPRKVKKAAGALYDRSQVYEPALAAGDEAALAAALAAHVTGGAADKAAALARYAIGLSHTLSTVSGTDLLDGRTVFPPTALSEGARA